MISDSKCLPKNQELRADICIVGAGPAGIALACEFIDYPVRVCLLESGGMNSQKNTQDLSKGQITGLPYRPLDAVRLRSFGGTSNWWHSMCQQFDDIDFEQRDWIPYSGWPFQKSHLLPFYHRAERFFQVSISDTSLATDLTFPYDHTTSTSHSLITRDLQLCPHPKIKDTHRSILEQASNIDCYLNANVSKIFVNRDGSQAVRIHVHNLNGHQFSVSAKVYVLATGGIENARILLASDSQTKTGLGNEHDLVGRFFMTHPFLDSGVLLSPDRAIPKDLFQYQKVGGVKSMVTVGLSRSIQYQKRLLGFNVRLRPSLPEVESSGVSSMLYLLKEFYMLRGRKLPQHYRKHLRNMWEDLSTVVKFGFKSCIYPPFITESAEACYLDNSIETTPNPSSRVFLLEENDVLGMKRIALNWQMSIEDKTSLIRSQEILKKELARLGVGRLIIQLSNENQDWPLTVRGTAHHIGTTRMNNDPTLGVVDENCKLHSLMNVYIAGSSTFPTCGSVPPTLTIVALSIRLADYIKKIFHESL